MTNNSPRYIAYKTLFQNKLYSSPDYDDLQHIIEFNKFTVINYKKNSNSEYVSELINKLGIEDEIKHSDSFLYIKNNLRLIFLNSDISGEDKCLLLRHELGHILDPHLISHSLNYSKIKREEFANEFSCYFKNPGVSFKFFMLLIVKWKLLVSLITVIVFISGLLLFNNPLFVLPTGSGTVDVSISKAPEKEYYITSSGKKYHKKFCIVVKHKSNLTKGTLDEVQEAGYKPCLICIGDEE